MKCNSESCHQFFYKASLPTTCPQCGSSCSELKFDAGYPDKDIEVYKDSNGIRWQLVDYKLIKLPARLQPWPVDPRRSVPGSWWPFPAAASLLCWILAFILQTGTSQAQTASFHYPFTIHTIDTNYKEIGFFKFDPVKKTVITRGNQGSVFSYFYSQVYVPQQNTWAAADSVLQYVNDLGQITDTVKFKAAAAAYYRRKNYPY